MSETMGAAQLPDDSARSGDARQRSGARRARRLSPAKPQPKPPQGEALPIEEAGVGSGSATGFVSMLAKRQFGGDSQASVAGKRYPLPMAKEVGAGEPAEANSVVSPARRRPSKGWRLVVGVLAALLVMSLAAGTAFWIWLYR